MPPISKGTGAASAGYSCPTQSLWQARPAWPAYGASLLLRPPNHSSLYSELYLPCKSKVHCNYSPPPAPSGAGNWCADRRVRRGEACLARMARPAQCLHLAVWLPECAGDACVVPTACGDVSSYGAFTICKANSLVRPYTGDEGGDMTKTPSGMKLSGVTGVPRS